jgi:TolB-like protein
MLYQLAIGDFHKAISPGWEAGIEDSLIREDIAAAACGDPARRLASAAEFEQCLRGLERRRIERNRLEEARQREQIAQRKRAESRIRRPWIAVACLASLALAASLYLRRRSSSPIPSPKTVAVLPFRNVGSDHSVDFLSLALPDEVATSLGYTRGLSIRPFVAASESIQSRPDLLRVGHEMNVTFIVTGHFLRQGDQLQLTLEAIDAENDRVAWLDTFNVPAHGMIELREKLVARTQGALAAALGASALTANTGTHPTSKEAYDLYLRAVAIPLDTSRNRQAIAMLEKSVGLDSTFAPAWLVLAARYYIEGRYANGGRDMVERYETAAARAVALDPNYGPAGAYLANSHVERGELARAFQEAENLVRQHPESVEAHSTRKLCAPLRGIIEGVRERV